MNALSWGVRYRELRSPPSDKDRQQDRQFIAVQWLVLLAHRL